MSSIASQVEVGHCCVVLLCSYKCYTNEDTNKLFSLVTDEATFTKNGLNNFHNNHVWVAENPLVERKTRFQYRFLVNF